MSAGAAITAHLRRITGSPIVVADPDWAGTQVVPNVDGLLLSRQTRTIGVLVRAYDVNDDLLTGVVNVQPIMYGPTINASGEVDGTIVGGGLSIAMVTTVPEQIDVRGIDAFTLRFVSTLLAAKTLLFQYYTVD